MFPTVTNPEFVKMDAKIGWDSGAALDNWELVTRSWLDLVACWGVWLILGGSEDGLGTSARYGGVEECLKSGERPNLVHQTKSGKVVMLNEKGKLKVLRRMEVKSKIMKDSKKKLSWGLKTVKQDLKKAKETKWTKVKVSSRMLQVNLKVTAAKLETKVKKVMLILWTAEV